MDVLQKILVELERTRKSIIDMSDEDPEFVDVEDWFDSGVDQGKLIAYEVAKEIIRSHMDDGKDINVNNSDAPYITITLNEDGVAEVYDDTYDITIHCESEEEQGRVVGILERYPGWIPVEDTERTPENESYVLVSFSNFSLPDIARYEENDEGGTYYPGDDEDSYLKYGLFVNAWTPLPELYREDIKTNEGSENDV